MNKLTPDKSRRLTQFWSGLPAPVRAKVLSAAETAAGVDAQARSVRDILAMLDAACAPDPETATKQALFAPLAPLTAAEGAAPPSLGRFSYALLDGIWTWLESEGHADAARAIHADDGDWTELRVAVGEALAVYAGRASGDAKLAARLTQEWGKDAPRRMADAAAMLRHAAALEDALTTFPAEIKEFEPEMVSRVRDEYETLAEGSEEAALWLLVLVMGRLKKPWQIFRAVEKIGRRGDDLVVSKTDLAAIGDLVLEDAAFFVASFAAPLENPEQARKAAEGLQRYVALTVGMTREFGVRKDGRWGKMLFALRNQASSQMEKALASVDKALAASLPETGRGGALRMPPQEVRDRAEARLIFLAATRELASLAAVSGPCKKAEEAASERLNAAATGLLDEYRAAGPEQRAGLEAALDLVARLTEAMGEAEAASLVRRRVAAAHAA
ncbi:MAG: hypothetical protein KIS81_09535 [Maricaulaceae bacterium]|nr:hypothetical protein [Maricaulaceae bacterium]